MIKSTLIISNIFNRSSSSNYYKLLINFNSKSIISIEEVKKLLKF